MSSSLLSFRNVSVQRGGAIAVRDLTLDIALGEIVALIGLNGAGKSSILRAAMGLEALTEGKILFREQSLAEMGTPERARRGIGYCPEGRRLFDLGSTNGTFVNEQQIEAVELNPGDVVRTGETTFTYMASGGADPGASDSTMALPSTSKRLNPESLRCRWQPEMCAIWIQARDR